MSYSKKVIKNFISMLKGLKVTLRYLFSPPITIQYPWQKLPVSERFRGFLEFDPQTCIACGMCAKACPVQCISMTIGKDANGKRVVTSYKINFGLCQFCRLCEESCPTAKKAIKHGKEYERAFSSWQDLIIEMCPATTEKQSAK